MPEIDVVDKNNKKIDTLKLSDKIFDGRANRFLLQQVVNMYLANQRKSFAKVKTREEVRGGGKKPWRQKGTGRARAGSIRSPLWRGGGVTFGPSPKDWHYQVPKKVKRLALISAINAKLNEGNVIVIDRLEMESHKTKDMFAALKLLKLDVEKTVIIPACTETNLLRASHNIKKISMIRNEDVNAYDVIVNDKILFEKEAIKKIEKRLGQPKRKPVAKPKTGSKKEVA
jgi:large subunit ribosomal protein L4